MITVYSVRRHHFGMYQQTEGDTIDWMETVRDYTDYVQAKNGYLTLLTEEDEEYEQVRQALGCIQGPGKGTLIGWKDEQGEVWLELVCPQTKEQPHDSNLQSR